MNFLSNSEGVLIMDTRCFIQNLSVSYQNIENNYPICLSLCNEPLCESFFCFLKVAEGTAALYTEQLRGIQHVTDRGAQQLSVDVEYLTNVLSALSMQIPPALATFLTCFSTPRDQLKDLLKSDSGKELDLPTANLVCKMRRINLD